MFVPTDLENFGVTTRCKKRKKTKIVRTRENGHRVRRKWFDEFRRIFLFLFSLLIANFGILGRFSMPAWPQADRITHTHVHAACAAQQFMPCDGRAMHSSLNVAFNAETHFSSFISRSRAAAGMDCDFCFLFWFPSATVAAFPFETPFLLFIRIRLACNRLFHFTWMCTAIDKSLQQRYDSMCHWLARNVLSNSSPIVVRLCHRFYWLTAIHPSIQIGGGGRFESIALKENRIRA